MGAGRTEGGGSRSRGGPGDGGLVLVAGYLADIVATGAGGDPPYRVTGRGGDGCTGWCSAHRIGVRALPAVDPRQRRDGQHPLDEHRRSIAQMEHLPGVRSSAAFAGLDANPVVRGRVDDSFLTNSVASSVDGAFYRQDTLSVLSGRLPHASSAHEIALTPGIARLFGVGVGGTVHYQLYDGTSDTPKVIGSASFRVTGFVEAPPALVDQFDAQDGAFLSQAGHGPFRAGDLLLVGGASTGPGQRRPAGAPEVPDPPGHRGRPRLYLRRTKTGHCAPPGPGRHPSPGRRLGGVRRTGRPGPLDTGEPEPGPMAPTLGRVAAHPPGVRPHPPRCHGDLCPGPRLGRGVRGGAGRGRRHCPLTPGPPGAGTPVRSGARAPSSTPRCWWGAP